MTIHPTIRGVAITLAGLAAVALITVVHYQAAIAELTFRLTGAQVEAMPNWAKVKNTREIFLTVPALKDELARALKAGTKPVAAAHVSSGPTEFDWPPRGSTAPPGPIPATGPVVAGTGKPTGDPPSPLLVSASAEGALTGMADGSIRSTWKMFATLTRGDWTETRELQDVHADVAIDPALAKAWKVAANPPPRVAFFRPPKDWRLGTTCGAGISYGVRGPDVAVACVWGVEF